MRTILIFFLLIPALLHAQQGTPSGWARVQAVKPGTIVSLKTLTHSQSCKVAAVDADSISCVGTSTPVARLDILKVTIHRRALSTAVGFVAGGALGAAIGAASGSSNAIGGRGLVALVIGAPAAVIGAIIGAATDFTHSTLYKAP